MNPLMNLDRYWQLDRDQQDAVLAWLRDELGTDQVRDAELTGEGQVTVTRLLNDRHIYAVWPTTGCSPIPLAHVHETVPVRTLPPWIEWGR